MTQTATAPQTGESRRGSHDWHSAEYVRQWVEENEARAEARRPQFDLIADFIPHRADAAISILDVGAGWGPVTRHLLQRFPNARATLLDYSDEMFGQARERLGQAGMTDRVWFVKGDLSLPGALDGALREAGGTFDAIVSSSCIHNVRPTERIPVLYAESRRHGTGRLLSQPGHGRRGRPRDPGRLEPRPDRAVPAPSAGRDRHPPVLGCGRSLDGGRAP
jgi:SAM-dependent methyltransferase